MSNQVDRLAGLSMEEKRALLAQKLQEKAAKSRSFPLSYNQQRMWLVEQLTPGNSGLNIPFAARIKGTLNAEVVEQAINHLVRRHETLRTSFSVVGGEPIQTVHPLLEFRLSVDDLSHLPQPAVEMEQRAFEEANRPFDISQAPLFRASLFRLGEADYVFQIVLHHIIADGSSLGIFFRELGAIYGAILNDQAPSLSPLSAQYADFVNWQRSEQHSTVMDKQLEYWREQLDGSPPLLFLPTDHPRPSVQTHDGGHVTHVFSTNLTNALHQLSRQEGVTLFMTLLSAFYILLGRLTGLEDIPVGSPIFGRNRSEIEGLMGIFINNVVLRTDLSGNPTFRDLLQRVRSVALGAYAHQDVPFERLIDELRPKRDPSHTPFFQVFFNLLNFSEIKLPLPGATVEFLPSHSIGANFDITFNAIEHDDIIEIEMAYNSDLFEADTISRMIGHYQSLLEGIVANPAQPIMSLSILTERERHQILVDWNNTQVDFPLELSLPQMFEQQVARTPAAIAAMYEDQAITYAELNQRANRLAHHLLSLGVKSENMIGVHLERGIEMLVALFGVLKAGGAYVPMDPAFPRERLGFMIEDAEMSFIISQADLVAVLPEHHAVVICIDTDNVPQNLDTNLSGQVSPDNLAYVIFTSGSTGRPKGVQVLHRGLTNFLLSMRDKPGLTANDVMLAITTLSFDIAGLELYLPLLVGGKVVLLSRDAARDGRQIAAALERYDITVMQATPASWQLLLESGWSGQVRLKMLCGGEALTQSLVEKLLHRGKELWNVYGPTETTIWSTVGKITRQDEIISIGQPIANTDVYVLDKDQQPLPVGMIGTLYIGGIGVARGYLKRPELTDEKFIPNPFGDGRIYNTGDLARWLPDGRLECLGRADNQVKIRGFRIELGEIEAVLEHHQEVEKAVVIAREDRPGDKRLVGYVTLRDGVPPAAPEIRDYANSWLPSYMVPSVVVVLDAFPLTPNGKVDRRALPSAPAPETKDQTPVEFSATETLVADIWRTLLNVEYVSPYDNFFDLGGHSLLAMQVVTRIENATGTRIAPAYLRFQTLKQLAASIEALPGDTAHKSTAPIPLDHPGENREVPLYFGDPEVALFGIYYRPMGALKRDLGVVICPPWGQEYIRAHRACHQLALRLSNAGIPVLRFDYYGTGDSAGDDIDHTVSRSLQDISRAINELRAHSGTENIALVGLRLGGALAALAGMSLGNVARLVLWDPIVSGSDYLEELKAWHRNTLMYYLGGVNPASDTQALEVLGFSLSEDMLDELKAINLSRIGQKPSNRVLLVERQPNEATTRLRTHLQTQGVILNYQEVTGPQMWTENPDKALVPHQTLEAIVKWITEV